MWYPRTQGKREKSKKKKELISQDSQALRDFLIKE
jgi:hypothetical protein